MNDPAIPVTRFAGDLPTIIVEQRMIFAGDTVAVAIAGE
jgi:hypothetical protein